MGNASPNGFSSSTTTDQVMEKYDVSLKDKNVIVTGANTGIGKETARVLAKAGANVILACRDMIAGSKALEEIKQTSGSDKVQLISLDLSSLESVKQFANKFNSLKIPLHLLILNAGVMACPLNFTKEGYELQWGTNHLGHFYLTKLLLESLKKAAPSRVVVVSSLGHQIAYGGYWDLKSYSSGSYYPTYLGAWIAYGRSKLSNILFAKELNDRYQHQGITAYSLHPGNIPSDLQRHMTTGYTLPYYIWRYVGSPFLKSIPQGAATTVFCAVTPELEAQGGCYYSDCKLDVPSKWATDKQKATELWEYSEQLIENFESSNSEKK